MNPSWDCLRIAWVVGTSESESQSHLCSSTTNEAQAKAHIDRPLFASFMGARACRPWGSCFGLSESGDPPCLNICGGVNRFQDFRFSGARASELGRITCNIDYHNHRGVYSLLLHTALIYIYIIASLHKS